MNLSKITAGAILMVTFATSALAQSDSAIDASTLGTCGTFINWKIQKLGAGGISNGEKNFALKIMDDFIANTKTVNQIKSSGACSRFVGTVNYDGCMKQNLVKPQYDFWLSQDSTLIALNTDKYQQSLVELSCNPYFR